MSEWQPIETAPHDGSYFDVRRHGRRFVDCCFDDAGNLTRLHGYPAITQMFIGLEATEWMPRPVGLVLPYERDERGRLYVP